MGPQEEYIETVVTCEGDYYDPEFHTHLQNLSKRLQSLLTEGDRKLIVKKVEPWNSVRVTFNIPKEAAVRLKQLAEQGDHTLRELGVLAVQIEGHRVISLTIAGKNNEPTELVLQTSGTAAAAGSAGSVFDLPGTDEINIPGPSNVESTRRNIAQYLRDQGGSGNLFDSLFSQNFIENLKPPDTVGATVQGPPNPAFGQFPFGLRGVANHSSGNQLQLHNEQLPLPPGFPPGSFPSPSLPHTHSFSSPTTSHNQSPLSPNYPTPPPSVSNPSSPGSRTANFNNLAMPGINTAVTLNSLPRLLGNRDITSSSPLLVNLLQNDIGGLAHLNNLMPNKMPGMPFPLSDMGQPPAKRRRKPRKSKPDAGKSRSPAGQEVLTGTASSIPVAPSTCDAMQEKSAVGSSQELSVKENRTDELGQLTQEMGTVAHISAASVMNTTSLSSRSALSGICHSPGQAVSPRVQSPRTQSPVCAQSPGWSKTQGTFGNNPPHIVNPVTGQLEPASCVEVQQPANEHVIKDGSLDSDDMGSIQLQPPPNPLVELNKDITASKEANLEVPSLSAPSQKQSSPKAISTMIGSHTKQVDSLDVISEHSVSAALTRSVTTSAATSVTGLNGHAGVELVRRSTACGLSRSVSLSPDTSLPSSESSIVSTVSTATTNSNAMVTGVTVLSVSVPSSVTVLTTVNAATTPTASLHPRVSVMEKSIYSSPKLMSHSVSSSIALPPSSISDHSLHPAGGCQSVSSSATQQSTIGSHSPIDSLPPSVSSVEVSSVVTSAASTSAVSLIQSVPPVHCTPTSSMTTCVSSDVSVPENTNVIEKADFAVVPNVSNREMGQSHLQHEPSENSFSQPMTEHKPCSSSEAVPTSTSQSTPSSDITGQGAVDAVDDQMSPSQNEQALPVASSPVLADNATGNMEQDTSAEHSDGACQLVGGCMEDGIVSKSIGEASPDADELLKTETSEQGSGLVNCVSPDPALSGSTPEHSGTDGSNTSSVTAHSQGKDSGIADVGAGILGSITCLEKSEEDGNSEMPEHGRSNGASTSEASPLSEVDTVSSGHQSRSPSVRLVSSVGLTNHDSELSSHSFDDHICPASLSQNNMSERVPKIVEAADDHDGVEEKLSDGQPVKAELHKCGDKNVITVGYALSKDQPMVDLSLSGLSNKNLPFLTEPSSIFEKDTSSIRLKEFDLDDSIHATNNVQKMKAVSLTHSSLNNGEAQAKDCLNWSKMLNLSPVLLGRSDLNPGGDDKGTGIKNCITTTSAAPANGDNLSSSVSESSMCKVSLTAGDSVDTVVTVQAESASMDSIHTAGISDTVSDKVLLQQDTSSADLHQCNLVSETVERLTGDTRPEYDESMMASTDTTGDGNEAAASPGLSSHTENGMSVSCITSSDDVMTSVMASSSDDHTSTEVTMPSDTTCSASSSSASGAQSPMSDSLTVMSPSQLVAILPTTSSEQGIALTNTFGASMVTTIVTSAVSMGSVLSTSFSMTASSTSAACMPTTTPTMVCSAQVTTVSAPVAIASSVPTMVSCTQDPKMNTFVLHAEAPVTTQEAPSQSVPVTLLGPHISGVAHQVIRMKQVDRDSIQILPRIVPMNNGVHVDQLPQSVNQVSSQLGAVEALSNTAISEQYESRKPHAVAYTVHPCATIHEEHATIGPLHANVIHVPLVQSIGNCVSTKAVHPMDNQPTKLVMASLQHVAHVVSQRSFDEKNDLHQEEVVATTKTADVSHNEVTSTLCSVEPHPVVGAQPGLLQLDQTQCPGKCIDSTSENKCSKDKHPSEPDRTDNKPSRGISIMKPLYDRESEIEEELHFVTPESTDGSAAQKVVKSVEEVHSVTNQLHSNQLSNIVLPKSKSPFTIAQILEEADKQRRNQAQLKQKALLATQTDCNKPEVPGINDSLNISQLGNKTVFQVSGIVTPVKSTKSGFAVGSTPAPVKSLVPNLEFGKNAGSHLASFVQKSLQTPVLFNSAPHPITSPRFPLNLTESVKKVMNAIPRTDTTPPPSPLYNKGPASLTAPPSPSRLRAKSTSPIAHSAGLFSLPVHKRNNNEGQTPVSLESATSVKLISVSDTNQVVDDQAVLSQGTLVSDTTKTEKCAEVTQKPLDDSSSEKCLPPTKTDVKSVPPVWSSVSLPEAGLKAEASDQAPITRKYEGSGEDSFSSEHSYSAKPPGNMEKPICDVTTVVSPRATFELDEDNQVLPETSIGDLEKVDSVISLSVSAPIELTVVTDEQIPLDEATTDMSGCASSVVLSPLGHSLTATEGLNKVLPVGRSDGAGGGKIHMISPVLPIASSQDDREGTGQTLVIKIVGAHASPVKDSTAGIVKSDAMLSPSLSATVAKEESGTTDASVMTVCQKPASVDGPMTNETKVCTKRKNSNSEIVDSSVNHEQKSLRAETDTESVQSLSPFTDDLGNFYHKRRSPSIDALSETSSTDGQSIPSNRTDNIDKVDSPASRPTRMATRNHGRRRNSPSDSSSDTPVKDERGDSSIVVGTQKPSVVTRGSKRRFHSNNQDDDSGVQDKKKRLDPDLTDASKQADSKPDDVCIGDVKGKGNSARGATTKSKANSSHDPVVGHDEKQKGRKATAKVNDVSKDENNATKRGQKTKSLADIKDDTVQQGKLDQKDEVVDTKGKRTTRSSRTKDHCELPNAAQLKRRRTSRDHR